MTDIEIRAQSFANPDNKIDYDCDLLEEGYIKGATEQKAIDDSEWTERLVKCETRKNEQLKKALIDKACKVFKDFMRVQYAEDIDESMERYFRKAMED